MSDLRSGQMTSQQATQARPAATDRFAAFLEENGLLVIVLGAFAIALLVGLRSTGCRRTTRSRSGRTAVAGPISSGLLSSPSTGYGVSAASSSRFSSTR